MKREHAAILFSLITVSLVFAYEMYFGIGGVSYLNLIDYENEPINVLIVLGSYIFLFITLSWSYTPLVNFAQKILKNKRTSLIISSLTMILSASIHVIMVSYIPKEDISNTNINLIYTGLMFVLIFIAIITGQSFDDILFKNNAEIKEHSKINTTIFFFFIAYWLVGVVRLDNAIIGVILICASGKSAYRIFYGETFDGESFKEEV